jgi:hypothetical protein
MSLNERQKYYIKLTVTAALAIVNVYVLYGICMNLIAWLNQPRFAVAGGGNTVSLGFLIQLAIYAGIFLITGAAQVVTAALFYKKRGNLIK